MATKISAKILIIILRNVQSSRSTQDLYSSLLVNRIWCKVTIPILWELTFDAECYIDGKKKLKKKALCIRTYISCMDTQARTLLVENGFDLSSSPPQATFDYPSFSHNLIINNLACFSSIYSQQIIDLDQDDNNNNDYDGDYDDYDADYDYNDFSITKSRILFHEICKLIINRCEFLDCFKVDTHEIISNNCCNYGDLIGSILDLPGAPKVFEKLESFASTIRNYEYFRPLYESLTLICDNILNMNLEFYSYYQMSFLAKFISVQKRLENLSIDANYLDCGALLWDIISHRETLKSLRLISVNFYEFNEESSSIGQFTSLQELSIESCCGLYNPECLILASSFTHLSSFHYFHFHDVSQELIIKILETANTNLRNIRLYLFRTITFDILLAISNYCTKVTKLTLHNLDPEQLIAIFNNNLNELRRFSFCCRGEGFDLNELLYQMSENIPESLETIEIMMTIYENPWIFSADSLRNFFERWRCKGGRNKKVTVRHTRHTEAELFTLSDEHFKVIEEYGIQFNLEEI